MKRCARDVLPALGLTVTKAAAQLGVTWVALSRVLNSRAAISPEMALRPEGWLGWKTAAAPMPGSRSRPRTTLEGSHRGSTRRAAGAGGCWQPDRESYRRRTASKE